MPLIAINVFFLFPFFWFEELAHFPQWTENEKYNQFMTDLLKQENL